MKRTTTILTTIVVLVIAPASMVYAAQIINYQGYLADSDGNPVADGDYLITFTIYDGGGVSHWTSGPLDIPVSNGMFSHNLGSVVPIPDDVFKMAELYLGIRIGDDPEISPKTLLTSAPSAAVAQDLTGASVETEEGKLVVKNVNGDSALVFIGDIDSHLMRVHPPDPCVPPDPCAPAIEIEANNKNRITIHPPEPCVPPEPCEPAIELSANSENRVDVYYPGQDTDAGIIQIKAGPTEGGVVEVHAADPANFKRVSMGGSTADTGYVRLLGGEHGAEYKLVELTSHTNNGGAMSFFNSDPTDGREMMTLNSSPTEGTSIVGFNPQPEPPGKVAFELGLNSSVKGDGGGMMAVYDSDSVNASLTGGTLQVGHRTITDYPSGSFTVNPSTCELTMTGEGAAGSPAVISMVARSDSAKVGIGTDAPVEALHVVGNITCTGVMYIYTDTKLKANIRPIENALNKIDDLNGVHYNYQYDQYPELKLPETDQVGLLAEEVEKVLPEIVYEDNDGNKLVAYSKLTPLLIEAIKELKLENEELKKRIEKLENY
jgi:hypothetical protein